MLRLLARRDRFYDVDHQHVRLYAEGIAYRSLKMLMFSRSQPQWTGGFDDAFVW